MITAVVAGLTVGITTLVSHSVDSGATAVQHLFKPAGSGAAISDTLSSNGLTINWSVQQGIGCEGSGDVYPVSETPGLNLKTRPGSGPKHGNKTWDQDPRAFGAVPVNPRMTFSLTGPTNHAVTITGLKFHVISRKPQVVGPWLDAESYHPPRAGSRGR